MNFASVRQNLKPWMMPIAMLLGIFFHGAISAVAFLAPYLIFTMLLITFCKINIGQVRVGRMVWVLLSVQLPVAIACYFAVAPLNQTVAQGLFICIFCPTATAAPVITQMLGGSIALLVSYSLVSNAAVALTAPTLFAYMGNGSVDLLSATLSIARHVVPLILAPLAVAIALQRAVPGLHRQLAQRQSISFYLWSVSLIIVVGRAMNFILQEPPSAIPEMVLLAVLALVACVGQFVAGRRIGDRYGDKISGAQGLGQKNTVLAIWMALTYLDPISSVAPAAYIIWQNTINSGQLFLKMKRENASKAKTSNPKQPSGQ